MLLRAMDVSSERVLISGNMRLRAPQRKARGPGRKVTPATFVHAWRACRWQAPLRVRNRPICDGHHILRRTFSPYRSVGAHAPLRRSAVMAMFVNYAYFVALYALIAPAAPWLFARRRATSAIWGATAVTLLLLFLFSALLWPACAAVNCGQGAILVAMLWVLASVSAMITVMIAGVLTYFRR
jgi:hypothetical protein